MEDCGDKHILSSVEDDRRDSPEDWNLPDTVPDDEETR